MLSRNIEAHSCNYCCCGKAVITTYSVCVCVCVSVALFMQSAKRMGRIILCYVACLSLRHFFIHKRHDFWRHVSDYKMCSNFHYKFV
jgi:hypothetical protein